MLVLNLVSCEHSSKWNIFKRNRRPVMLKRSNLCFGNKVFNIVDFVKEDIENPSFKRLLEVNRSRVLKCSDEYINSYVSAYLLDIRPYIKNAVLSGLLNEMQGSLQIDSLCVLDDDFKESDEYYMLANRLRKLSVVCDKCESLKKFKNRCYNNLGLLVDTVTEYDNVLDLNNIIKDKSTFLSVNGHNILLYADPSYFEVDDRVATLLRYNVPKEYACASLYM